MANLKNLKRVRETIEANQPRFNYYAFFSRIHGCRSVIISAADIDVANFLDEESCGTCACIAGFCLALIAKGGRFYGDTFNRASDFLDLCYTEALWLFEPASAEEEQHRESRYASYAKHLCAYPHNGFEGFRECSKQAGYTEALRRLDFLIEYYSKEEQNGKLGESQEGS